MELKTYFAQDRNGSLIPSASVAIYLTGTTTLVSGLTNVSGEPLTNPFTADSNGKIQFRAPDGIYDMQVSLGSTTGVKVTFQCVDVEQQLSDANSAASRAEEAAESIEKNAASIKANTREQWRRSLADSGLSLVDGSFEDGATVTTNNEAVWHVEGGQCYTWGGTLPKTVTENSTPESTGGISAGAWSSVSGITVRNDIDFLQYANGVRLSEYLNSADPINEALEFARSKKLHLVIDTDITFTNPIILYSTDRIYDFGAHTLTKSGNGTPSPALPTVTAPARNNRKTDFNKDAAIIVVHPENGFAIRNVIDGLRIVTSDRCDYAVFAPFWAHNIFKNCMFYGFRQGIRSYDVYAMVWEKIYSNYWYSPGGVQEYSDLPCYQLEDPENFTTGTSGSISNVTSIFYRCSWRLANREYTTLNSCGGEAINKPVESSNIPYTFEFINCNDLVLNTPYTENLHGGFFKVLNDNSAVNRGGTIVINGPQAIAGIRGTPTNVGAKLFDVSGNANVVVNGGYMVTAASGYYLDFAKVTGDSYLRFIGTDMRYMYSNISADTGVYDGVMKIDSLYTPEVILTGVNTMSTYSGVVPFNTLPAANDRYTQAQNLGYVRTAVPGIYEIEAEISFPSGTGNATVAIKSSASATDNGSTLAIAYHNLSSGGRSSVRVKWRGRLTSNRYLYVTVAGTSAQSSANADTNFIVKMA